MFVSNKEMKIFGKSLQTWAQDHNRPLGQRNGRLMMTTTTTSAGNTTHKAVDFSYIGLSNLMH